ncbi:MAG TPA: hypothetical protein VJ725_34820, partial [Thermoanaerobaculia bacterium]|nr:hypothetical protein [Thermoanaerobaculia bacterium]
DRRGLAQQLAGLGSIAQRPNAIRSRLLRGERGYVSMPVVAGDLAYFPPHLLGSNRGPEHRDYNRRANQILLERGSVALLRVADQLGQTREDRALRNRLEGRLNEVERAIGAWGGRARRRTVGLPGRTQNAEAARRFVSRKLSGHLRGVERGLAQGLLSTAKSITPQPRLPGLGALMKAVAVGATVVTAAGLVQEVGQAVLVLEAAVRREHRQVSGRGPLERLAQGDVSTYRLLRLTSGHPEAISHFRAPEFSLRDLPAAVREYRRSRAEIIRFARTSVREGRSLRESAGEVARRSAAVLAAREQVVNASLQKLGVPSLRLLSGTARGKTESLARFAQACREAGISVGTVVRVVVELGPIVLGGAFAGAAVTLASRLVLGQVFGLGRDLAKDFLYGERERGR